MIKIKEGFKGQRLASLPESLLAEYSSDPLVSGLYPRKIGFFPRVKYHCVRKTAGTDYYMLIFCTEGRGWYEIDGKRFTVETNSFFTLSPDTPYAFGADDDTPWSIYWVHFRGPLAGRFMLPSLGPEFLKADSRSRVASRISLFEDVFRNFSDGYIKDNMISACMYLYSFLASFRWTEQYNYHSAATQSDQTSLSRRAIYYMQENVTRSLTLESLAANFNYSPSHFSSLFKKQTGMSPIDCFLRLKMQKACEYLELTDLKVNEIASTTGFSDAAYFTRLFTRIIGISPLAYRRMER